MTVLPTRRALRGLSLAGAFGLSISAGSADKPVGHSKTVTRTTEEHPGGATTTITETREKDTKVDRP